MLIRVNTHELIIQAGDFNREILNSMIDKRQADTHVRNVDDALNTLIPKMHQHLHKLIALHTRALSTISFGEGYVNELWSDVQNKARQRDAARADASRASQTIRDINRRASTAPIDTITSRTLSSAQGQRDSAQRRADSLTTQVHLAEIKTNEARIELANVRTLSEQIIREIQETNRMLIQIVIAKSNIAKYNATKPLFNVAFSRGVDITSNMLTFARNIRDADENGAAMFEALYIDSISVMPPLAQAIIDRATSQIGASETSENFVPGKPYAQEGLEWCGDFVRWVIEDSGIELRASDREALASTYRVARAWAEYGASGGGYGRHATSADAAPGDILIDRYDGTATPGGHVSIVVETNVNGNPNLVRTVGGNENNQVRTEIKDLSIDNRYLITLAELNN